MSEEEIRFIFKDKQKVIDGIDSCENEDLRSKLTIIMKNLSMIEKEYPGLITEMINSNVRYSDYHDSNAGAKENINFFETYYPGKDKELQTKNYLLYSFLKNIDGLVSLANEEEFSNLNELVEWCNYGDFYNDLVVYSEELRQRLELDKMNEQARADEKMSFTNEDNLYKILFTGLAYDDIKELPKHVRMQVIKKLNTPLATEKVVPVAEGVDHVRDAYDFPLQRIQVADDYRIAYVRRANVTAVLGIRIKSGKDSDYTRYDIVARNADKIYQEIDQFSLGLIPPSEQHTKTVELLQETYNKSRGKK